VVTTMTDERTNPDVAETPPSAPERVPDTNPDVASEDASHPAVEAGGGPEAGELSSAGSAEATATAEPPMPPTQPKHWYVVKVQSGREESIKEAIERRVKIDGLEEYFGQIVIPMEKVTEVKNNKRIVRERKLYPGYIMAEVDFNDRILYLFRETSGVGDFVGGSLNRPPPPMAPREVERMLGTLGQLKPTEIHAKPKFDKGDRVKVKDGTFKDMEGEVKEIVEAKNQVRVEVTIFGRPVTVDLEIWQVEEV
jgi:transcription termination/antitermination protein NusG